MDHLETKFIALQNRLAELAVNGRFALAFSGGIDSRFIAHTALLSGLKPLLIHATGYHIADEESRFAESWARSLSADFRLISANPLEVPEVAANDKKRCYYCKQSLFSRLKREAQGLALCDGTQASDLHGYRPGIAALRELGVVSPLLDAELSKPEIRLLAARTGMDLPEQRARPCLLTRFAYLLPPSAEQLMAIDKAEQAIEKTLRDWTENQPESIFPDFRLRQLSQETVELHLTPVDKNDSDFLDETLRQTLETAINREIAVPLSAIKIMPSLSGYFDRQTANQ